VKTIPLTKGQFVTVDDEDYIKLASVRWFASWDSRTKTYRPMRKVTIEGKRKNIHMAREIVNCPPHLFVDHINRNPLDNRKINLRICTSSENMRNRKIKNKHNYKGVHLRNGKWQARITKGKTKNLGNYPTAERAAIAYDEAAIELFKDFASLNFSTEKRLLLKLGYSYEKLLKVTEVIRDAQQRFPMGDPQEEEQLTKIYLALILDIEDILQELKRLKNENKS